MLGTVLVAEGRAHEGFPYIEQAYWFHREVDQPVAVAMALAARSGP
jgi:hypothetical protein